MKTGGEYYDKMAFHHKMLRVKLLPRTGTWKHPLAWNLFLHCKRVLLKMVLMVWANFDKNWSFKMSNIILKDQYQCDIFAAIKTKMLNLSRFYFLTGNYNSKKSLFCPNLGVGKMLWGTSCLIRIICINNCWCFNFQSDGQMWEILPLFTLGVLRDLAMAKGAGGGLPSLRTLWRLPCRLLFLGKFAQLLCQELIPWSHEATQLLSSTHWWKLLCCSSVEQIFW